MGNLDTGAGKGSDWRPTDKKKFDSSPLWKSKCCGSSWARYYVVDRYVKACARCGLLKTPEQGVTDVTALLRKEKAKNEKK